MRVGDFWFDELELAKFENNLENEIKSIRESIIDGSYRTQPIIPLPHPKKPNADKEPQARQSFYISTRDQLTFIALINIIGPHLDYQMPKWSYGHRLYRPVWYDEIDGKKILKKGWYRHTSGNIYRKWQHSWPLFRSHIYLTIRKMSKIRDKDGLSIGDKQRLDNELSLDNEQRLIYFQDDYWKKKIRNPYWGSLDFEKFYQNINTQCIISNVDKFLKFNFPLEIEEIKNLFSNLLEFKVDHSDWIEEELNQIQLDKNNKSIEGLPTGLMVAGFLANIALMDVDLQLTHFLDTRFKGKIAHFRFVDDHIILADSFKVLIEWIKIYESILSDSDCGSKVGLSKTQPKELSEFLSTNTNVDLKRKAISATKLDSRYPTPLMTTTLALVSNLARGEFLLLNNQEQQLFLEEIEHLLLAEIGEEEIRKDTRMSFAASVLSRNAATKIFEIAEIKNIFNYTTSIQKKIDVLKEGTEEHTKLKLEINDINENLFYSNSENYSSLNIDAIRYKYYYMLMKAIHEHPYKLRLWFRVLDYCKKTGHSDFNLFKTELLEREKDNPLTATYYRAIINQILTSQLFDCLNVLLEEDEIEYNHNISINYLESIYNLFVLLRKKCSNLKYERKVNHLLFESLKHVVFFLASNKEHSLNKGFYAKIEKLRELFIENSLFTSKDIEIHYNISYSAFIGWLDSKVNKPSSLGEGLFFGFLKNNLKLTNYNHIKLLLQNSKFIDKTVFRTLLKNKIAQTQISDNKNLQFELCSNFEIPQQYSRLISKDVKLLTRTFKSKMSLYDWVKACKKIENENPYDPRLSEWTSLKIISTVAELIFKDFNMLNIHPANYFLPRIWSNKSLRSSYWGDWKKEVNEWSTKTIEGNKNYSITKNNLFDSRYTIRNSNLSIIEKRIFRVHGLGMLLLGLLRNSFEWPQSFNINYYSQVNNHIIYSLIDETKCSSLTRAIIEGCLIRKQRETVFIKNEFLGNQPNQEIFSNDTTIDPPIIDLVNTFILYVNESIGILEEHQLTIHNLEPRQLVPISLEQLGKHSHLTVEEES